MANPHQSPANSRFVVYFDHSILADITPEDKGKQKFSQRVKGFPGHNKIELIDKSTIRGYGVYIDNMGIYSIKLP